MDATQYAERLAVLEDRAKFLKRRLLMAEIIAALSVLVIVGLLGLHFSTRALMWQADTQARIDNETNFIADKSVVQLLRQMAMQTEARLENLESREPDILRHYERNNQYGHGNGGNGDLVLENDRLLALIDEMLARVDARSDDWAMTGRYSSSVR